MRPESAGAVSVAGGQAFLSNCLSPVIVFLLNLMYDCVYASSVAN